jgi:hypothetical protein
MQSKIYTFIFSVLHIILILLVSYVILFSTSIPTLALTSFGIIIILVINYMFDDCPISLIEDKYHNISCIDYLFSYTINIFGSKYNKKLRSILTLEMIWIILLLCTEKLLSLLLFKKFILKNIL